MATVIACSRRRHKVQNDLNDWLIDDQNQPTLPLDHKIYEKFGLPVPDKKDIPAQKVETPVDLKEEAKKKKEAGGAAGTVMYFS